MGTSLGLVRTHTAGAPGSGASKRSAFVDFEPGNFLRLYKTAHSESMGARSNAISKENGGVASTGWDRFIVPRAQHLSDFQVNKLDPRAGQTRQIALAISEIPHTSTATRDAAARAAVK